MGDVPDGIVPPHDLDAEAAVLSAVLLDAKRRLPQIDFLKPFHFYSEAHRRIFEAALWLKLQGKIDSIDVVTVGTRLKDTGRLAQVGGMPYIGQILDSSAHVANVIAYAETLYEKWRMREVITRAGRVQAMAYAGVPIEGVQAFIDAHAIAPFVALARDSPAATLISAAKLVEEQNEIMVESSSLSAADVAGRTPGLPTGIREWDRSTGGMSLGAQTMLGAESGYGKSTLGLQIAIHNAGFRSYREDLADRRVGVVFFTGEMLAHEQQDRLSGHCARIDSRRIKLARVRPTLTSDEWDRYGRAKPLIAQLPIFFSERSDLTLDYVRLNVRQAVERSKRADGIDVKLVILDFLQRMKTPEAGRKQRDELIADNAMGLTELAKETGVAILTLVQMNPPDSKESPTGKPTRGLISFSPKRCEQEANQLWGLWRYDKKDTRVARLTCIKGREGGEDVEQDLVFEKEYGKFEDPAWAGRTSAFEGM